MESLFATLKTFYRFEAKKKYWFVIFVVLIVAAAVVGNLTPYFYKLFVESLESGDKTYLINLLYIFVGIRFLDLILNSLSYVVGDIVSFDAGVDARVKIFKHLQDLDFAFHTQKSTGSLISKMKRGDGAFYSLHHAIHHRILPVIFGFGVMMYFFAEIDPRISWLVFISLVINFAVTRVVVSYNIKKRKEFNKEEDKISGIIVDNIINFETVKLFAKENWERGRLKSAFAPWVKKLWGYANSFRVFDLSVGGLVNASILVILLISLNMQFGGELTTGDFILVLGFVNTLFPKFFDLVYGFRDIAKNYADIEKYFGILNYNIEIKDPQKPKHLKSVNGEIEYKNVSFTYEEGKEEAIKNFSLDIRQGQSVAFVGPSGSGKTTLVKLLLRFYDLDTGKILLDGVDIKRMRKSHFRSFIGVVPQEPVLFNNSIEFNIGYGKKSVTKKQVVSAAKMANLHDFVISLPKKYKTQVGERGVKLSGGQKQRLAIARMILSDPEVIIFDEATSQLDSENEAKIQEAFWKASKNKTTIIIAHRLATAMRADKIIVVDNGQIVEEGSHKALITKEKGIYKKLWQLQSIVE